jgi:hypothetical protein
MNDVLNLGGSNGSRTMNDDASAIAFRLALE